MTLTDLRTRLLEAVPQNLSALTHAGEWRVLAQPVASLEIACGDLTAIYQLPKRLSAAMAEYPGSIATGLLNYHLHDPNHPHVPGVVIHLYAQKSAVETPKTSAPTTFQLLGDFQAEWPAPDYLAAVRRIHDYLASGDCYQVNLAQRLLAQCLGDSRHAWLALLSQHRAPHACYMDWSGGTVFGVSPERFLSVHNGQVCAEPIKGSRPRGATPAEDQALACALQASDKDRAENLMIVDLTRNDLGKVCTPGSIRVEQLFELRRFSNVQHLVSKVSGQLRPDMSPLAALLACFPGGSITGAPKKRAMEIIAELEPAPRDFYCGSFFWMDDANNLDANILIRTFQRQGTNLICHGGGGIVFDSLPEKEHEESLFKIQALIDSLQAPFSPS